MTDAERIAVLETQQAALSAAFVRMEAKIDYILQVVDPKNGPRLLGEIDEEYAGRHTDARFNRLMREEKRAARSR